MQQFYLFCETVLLLLGFSPCRFCPGLPRQYLLPSVYAQQNPKQNVGDQAGGSSVGEEGAVDAGEQDGECADAGICQNVERKLNQQHGSAAKAHDSAQQIFLVQGTP